MCEIALGTNFRIETEFSFVMYLVAEPLFVT